MVDEYTYDANGNNVKIVTTCNGEIEWTYEIAYNSQNKAIKYTQTYADGNVYIQELVYDDNGNVVEEITTTNNNDQQVTKLFYDEHGRLVKKPPSML